MKSLSGFHRFFARLHGSGGVNPRGAKAIANGTDLENAYAAYANAVTAAREELRQHGPQSKAFRDADTVSMRMFHRVKALQGIRNPRSKGESG